MRSFLPFLLLTLTACTDKSNTDTGSDTGEEHSTLFKMTAPNNGTFYVDSDLGDETEGEIICENTTTCDYEATLADGRLYLTSLEMSGFLTVTHTVKVENEDNGELFQVDWTGEGDYGLDFGWWCTNSYDGDSVFIESYIGESEDGSEVILIDLPLGGNATMLTGMEISGENESIYTGFVDTVTNSIHFEQWYDGELWKERDYTDCHE